MELRTSELVCPECSGPITSAGETVTCAACDVGWPVVLGIPAFSDPEFYYGEIPRESMRSALALGPERIPDVRARLAEAGPWLPLYTFDVSRADWRVPLGVPHGRRVLDYGCGLGAVSMALAPHYEVVCASDPTPERAAFLDLRARAEGRCNVTAVAADIDTLPFPKGSFDVVVIMGVLEWTPLSFPDLSPREAEIRQLRHLAKYLTPGGILVLGIENRIGIRYFMGGREEHIDLPFVSLMPRRLADAYARARGKGTYRNWTYSPSGTARLLTDAGLRDPEVYGAYLHYSFPDLVYPLTLHNAQASKLGSGLGTATNEHWRTSRVFPALRTGLERSRQFRKLAPSLLNRAVAPGGRPSDMGLGARVPEVVVPSRHVPGTPMRSIRFRPDGVQMTLRSRDEDSIATLRRVDAVLRKLGSRPWLPEHVAFETDGPDVVLVLRHVDGETATDRLTSDPDVATDLVRTVSQAVVTTAMSEVGHVPVEEVLREAKELGMALGEDTGPLCSRLAGIDSVPKGFAQRSIDPDRVILTKTGWVLTDWDDMADQPLPLDGIADLILDLHARLGLAGPLRRTALWETALGALRQDFEELADPGLTFAALRRAAVREGTPGVASALLDQ